MFGEDLSRFGRAWDPWRELNRIQDEVNRLFTGARDARPQAFPALNLWTNEEGAFVRAELPGLSAQHLDISVLGDTVTLSGKREPDALEKGASYHRRERDFGSFSRSFTLPFRVEADKVAAQFRRGVLEVFLPRAQADKARRINVKSE
jgi:HSP20 family protein